MGGGGGKKKKKPKVEYAQPLDFAALMRSANEQAGESARDQIRAQIEAYPELERLQLGTIQRIANNLNNQATRDARAALGRATTDTGDVRAIGQTLRSQAGETVIERQLREQAEADLSLGRSLNAAETRDAQQAARAAFAARGLGASMPSSAAEILNRDAMAQSRESSRRNFAAATNQMVTSNVTGRMGQAAGVLGQAAGMDLNNSNQQMAVDPYQRALGMAGIGSNISNNLTQGIGSTYANSMQMAGNIASFNANLLDTRANTAMNNWASMEAARRQASAAGQAGTMGMVGAGVGAAVGIGVLAI